MTGRYHLIRGLEELEAALLSSQLPAFDGWQFRGGSGGVFLAVHTLGENVEEWPGDRNAKSPVSATAARLNDRS